MDYDKSGIRLAQSFFLLLPILNITPKNIYQDNMDKELKILETKLLNDI